MPGAPNWLYDALAGSGVTPRMADYWDRAGLIDIEGSTCGSGRQHEWTADDVRRLRSIGLAAQALGLGVIPRGLVALLWEAFADGSSEACLQGDRADVWITVWTEDD